MRRRGTGEDKKDRGCVVAATRLNSATETHTAVKKGVRRVRLRMSATSSFRRSLSSRSSSGGLGSARGAGVDGGLNGGDVVTGGPAGPWMIVLLDEILDGPALYAILGLLMVVMTLCWIYLCALAATSLTGHRRRLNDKHDPPIDAELGDCGDEAGIVSASGGAAGLPRSAQATRVRR